MDILRIYFPTSGVETCVFLPPLVAFIVSLFTSMGGVSGAFLLLPFQVSFLHFTTPSVSATNFLYNIVATPSGVYRYLREGRLAWPLTSAVIIGTLPGILIGYYLRVTYMPDPRTFKLFVGCVLLYVGLRLFCDITARSQRFTRQMKALDEKFSERIQTIREKQKARSFAGLPPEAVVNTISFSLSKTEYEFWGERFSFSTPSVCMLAFVVGIIGGAYGIGGGAIIAPFCVTVFRLPVYTVAGAALTATFLASGAGLAFYSLIPPKGGVSTSPDWLLGFLFGVGGFLGIYCGARLQRFVRQEYIKLMLGFVMLFVSARYITQYFLG